MDIQFTTQIVKERRTHIAYSPEVDLSSCGSSKEKALANLKTAVRLFLEEAGKMGTLDRIRQEAGYRWKPRLIDRSLWSRLCKGHCNRRTPKLSRD